MFAMYKLIRFEDLLDLMCSVCRTPHAPHNTVSTANWFISISVHSLKAERKGELGEENTYNNYETCVSRK